MGAFRYEAHLALCMQVAIFEHLTSNVEIISRYHEQIGELPYSTFVVERSLR